MFDLDNERTSEGVYIYMYEMMEETMEEGKINEIIEGKKKTYGDKLSIPGAISPAIFFTSLFFFPLPPLLFFRSFSFHSLIYRVDNSSLSNIQ